MSLEGEIEEEKNEKNVVKDKPMQFKGEVEPNRLSKDYFSHQFCTGHDCNIEILAETQIDVAVNSGDTASVPEPTPTCGLPGCAVKVT